DDLRPALGRATDLDVHLDPLDAERRVGVPQQPALQALPHRRRALPQRPMVGARGGHRLAHLEVDAVLDADPPGRPDGDPARDHPDAQAPHRGGSAMSVIAADARLSPRATTRAHAVVRRRRYLSFVGTVVLSFVLVVWTLLPIYNMILISLEPEGDVFTDHIWPRMASGESFWGVLTQGHWYLEHFWRQFANSLYMGAW